MPRSTEPAAGRTRAWRVLLMSVQAIDRDFELWLDDHASHFTRPASSREYVDPIYLAIDLDSLDEFRNALARVKATLAAKELRGLADAFNHVIRCAGALSIAFTFSQWKYLDQALRYLNRSLASRRSPDDVLFLPHALVRTHGDAARAARRDPDTIFTMTPRAFEETVAGLLHLKGFEVAITPASRDRGFDIVAVNRVLDIPFKWIVECKQYARDLVTAPTVQQLFGAARGEEADRALLVTTSGFTRDALEFARQNSSLHLWNRSELLRQLAIERP